MIKPKIKRKKNLKKHLIKIHSLYIRYRDRNRCYTCGKKLTPTTSQNGHFVSRKYLSLLFADGLNGSLPNCHCQCAGCNVFLKGNMDVYAMNLVRDYGADILEKLNAEKKKTVRYSNLWYEEKIKFYKDILINKYKVNPKKLG